MGKILTRITVLAMILLLVGCSATLSSVSMIQLQKVSKLKDDDSRIYTIYKRDGLFYLNSTITQNEVHTSIEGSEIPSSIVEKALNILKEKKIRFDKNTILKESEKDVYYILTINEGEKIYQTSIDDQDLINYFEEIYNENFMPVEKEPANQISFSAIEIDE